MGFESSADIVGPSPPSSSSSKELRRIGKIRMTWEESVSLWAEECEHHRGRVKLQGGSLSFLNADELTYFDDAMVACTMESFEEGPLRGFSVDRFVSGQQVKVFGRKKPFSVSAASGIIQIIIIFFYHFLIFISCFAKSWNLLSLTLSVFQFLICQASKREFSSSFHSRNPP